MFNTFVAWGEERYVGVFFRRTMVRKRGKGVVNDWKAGEVMICCGVAVLNSSASLCNIHKLGLETSKGEAGDVFCRVVMKSNTTLVAASTEDVCRIEKLFGKTATVAESHGGLVVGI